MPHITALDSGAFLTYMSGDVGPINTLEWMNASGEITHEDTLEGTPASFVYARHDTAFMVTNDMVVGDTFYVNRVFAAGFARNGQRVIDDVLLTDTLSLNETTIGMAFDVRTDGWLVAVVITGHGTPSPNQLTVHIFNYEPHHVERYAPWDPGPVPSGAYMQYPHVTVTPEGGGVLAYNLRLSDMNCELCVQHFDAARRPAHILKTFPVADGANVNALDVHVQANTVYVMYTLNSLDYPERGGAYVRGFPLGDISDAVDERTVPLPEALALKTFPNPFNATARMEFDLPHAGKAELVIYNALGQEVARLVDGRQLAGHHEMLWEARGLASGLYFARLAAGEMQMVKKVMLVR